MSQRNRQFRRVSLMIRESFASIGSVAAQVFPMQYVCAHCRNPLAATSALQGYCPACAQPLYSADPWVPASCS